MVETTPNLTERNYGIDALRIFSMFLVVVLHVLGHGGVIKNAESMNGHIACLLNIFACCAVDVFALISGYVGYTDKPKIFKSSKVITFWAKVFFYSFGVTLVAFVLSPESVGVKTLIRSAFPIATKQYWYASCYIPLLLLMPWINKLIRSLDKKELTKLVAILVTLFSVYMIFAGRLSEADPFVLNYGFSVIWLTILYIIGAWVKRINLAERIDTKSAWLIIVICVLISWLFKDIFTGIFQTALFVTHTSPTILLISMSYLVIFSKRNLSHIRKKGITFFAPAAFGVYLIHEQPIIRDSFIVKGFTWIADDAAWLLVLEVIGCAALILFSCLIIEKLRLLLFDVLHINKALTKLGNKIDDVCEKLLNKICDSKLVG